jgi:hypothetical protein
MRSLRGTPSNWKLTAWTVKGQPVSLEHRHVLLIATVSTAVRYTETAIALVPDEKFAG